MIGSAAFCQFTLDWTLVLYCIILLEVAVVKQSSVRLLSDTWKAFPLMAVFTILFVLVPHACLRLATCHFLALESSAYMLTSHRL